MNPKTLLLAPRARDWGPPTIVRLARTPHGGLRTEVWDEGKGAWRPSATSVGKVGSLPVATAAELEASGVGI